MFKNRETYSQVKCSVRSNRWKLQIFTGFVDEERVINGLRQRVSVGLWELEPCNGYLSRKWEVWKYKHRGRTTLSRSCNE